MRAAKKRLGRYVPSCHMMDLQVGAHGLQEQKSPFFPGTIARIIKHSSCQNLGAEKK
jgi:hypothetical protein